MLTKDFKLYPWDNQIANASTSTRLGARQCIVREVSLDDTVEFLNKYHYQKSCNGQSIRLGLFYNGNLIGTMTFGKPRYTKRAQYELLRLCFVPSYNVIGGSQKLFSYFIAKYKPNSIISYCDKSKFTGDVYLKLGMKLIQNGRSRPHYWRESDKKHFTYKEVLRLGPDKLLSLNYGKTLSNDEIMLKEGFVKIFDEGQDAYLYLDNSQYWGYIYKITDNTNGKCYIGQHLGAEFDPNYFGSGSYITRVIKQRKEALSIEVLEWCKQDISDRELYYIDKYNTLYPNGYNLGHNKQWFTFNDPETISVRVKNFYQTENGKKVKEHNKQHMKDLYSSEKGKVILDKIKRTKELKYGKVYIPTQDELKQMYLVDNLSIDEVAERIKKSRTQTRRYLRNYGLKKSEELAKACEHRLSLQKYGTEMPWQSSISREKAQAAIKNKYGVSNAYQAQSVIDKIQNKKMQNYIQFVNGLSDVEWKKYLEEHPHTRLKKYRK